MPERSSKGGSNTEPNELIASMVEAITNEPDKKNLHAVALGRLGGKKGGIARAKKLTPKKRKEIARKAAYARWSPTR